jgi:NADH dehydrogenase
MFRVVLVHPGDFILPELGEELGRYAGRKLAARGVEIRFNTKVKAVTPREVELTDGTRIKSLTLVWTAGTSPHPLLNQLDLPKERNRLKTNALMEVEGCPGALCKNGQESRRRTGPGYSQEDEPKACW